MNGKYIAFVPIGYTGGPNDTSLLPPSNETQRGGHEDPNVALLRDIIEIWFCLPIALLGVLGNLVSLVVLCYMRKGKLRAVATMLQALAVSDTLVLVAGFWLRTMRYLGGQTFVYYHTITFPVFFSTIYVLRLVNTWLTVLLTFDRYVAVCHPLHAQSLCTTKRTYIQIISVVVASFAFCVPRYFESKIVYTPTAQYKTTWLMDDPLYAVIYRIVLFLIVQYILPMVILIALNGRVVWSLRFSTANQPRFSRNRPPSKYNVASLKTTHSLLKALVISTAHDAKTLAATHDASGPTPANTTQDAVVRTPATTTNEAVTRRSSASSVATTNQDASGTSTATSQHSSARTLTRIVVAIVLLCTVCHVVSMVSHVLHSVQTAFHQFPTIDLCRRYFANISNLLITFNSAVNFLIYCALSRNFRAILDRCLTGVLRRGRHSLRAGRSLFHPRRSTSSGTKRGASSPGQSMPPAPMSMTMMSSRSGKKYHGIPSSSIPLRDSSI